MVRARFVERVQPADPLLFPPQVSQGLHIHIAAANQLVSLPRLLLTLTTFTKGQPSLDFKALFSEVPVKQGHLENTKIGNMK